MADSSEHQKGRRLFRIFKTRPPPETIEEALMDKRLVDLLNQAQRWSDQGHDFLPTL
jgi:hypothetical protein